jgi:proteasome lid subunit RPN8/RPN11
MVAQALAEKPNECCGLLAGVVRDGVGRVTRRYPLTNELASPIEFVGDSKSHFQAHKDMRQNSLELLAIYHSHPTSLPIPSKTDLARNYDPTVVTLILGLSGPVPDVRVWWLTDSDYREAEWEVTDAPPQLEIADPGPG